jgi:hypothetical protein
MYHRSKGNKYVSKIQTLKKPLKNIRKKILVNKPTKEIKYLM